MSSRPVTNLLPPPLLKQMMVRWTLHIIANNVDALLSFCQQMPNDLLALPFHFQMERKTGLFSKIIYLTSVSFRRI